MYACRYVLYVLRMYDTMVSSMKSQLAARAETRGAIDRASGPGYTAAFLIPTMEGQGQLCNIPRDFLSGRFFVTPTR